MSDTILTERRGDLAQITLNRKNRVTHFRLRI